MEHLEIREHLEFSSIKQIRITASARSLSRGAVGSSARITGGRLTRPRAIATSDLPHPQLASAALDGRIGDDRPGGQGRQGYGDLGKFAHRR
jgi:hypothetical protein